MHYYINVHVTIVLGNFNEDLLIDNATNAINTFFMQYGFTQEVKFATTDQGTLLDAVYLKTSETLQYDVQHADRYYSDHHWVIYRTTNFSNAM